jgi:hypothetical protein
MSFVKKQHDVTARQQLWNCFSERHEVSHSQETPGNVDALALSDKQLNRSHIICSVSFAKSRRTSNSHFRLTANSL